MQSLTSVGGRDKEVSRSREKYDEEIDQPPQKVYDVGGPERQR